MNFKGAREQFLTNNHQPRHSPQRRLGIRAWATVLSCVAACVLPSCRTADQPPPPAWPLSGGSWPYQGSTPPWFVRLDGGHPWSWPSDISDDGKSLCGEVDLGDTTGAHYHGVRWESVSDWPPVWEMRPVSFPSTDAKDNPATSISPDGKFLTGTTSLPPEGNNNFDASLAYFSAGAVNPIQSQLLPFLPPFPKLVEGRAVSNGRMVVGHIGIHPDRYDINRSAPTFGVAWIPQGGAFTALRIDTEAGNPKASRIFDVTTDGRFIVGSGSSDAALQVYAEPGIASEAVLYRKSGANQFTRRWLGVPAGSARHFSRATSIASDSTGPNGLVIVGDCGGFHLDNYPNPGDRHVLDRRPAVWRVKGNSVTAEQLPLLQSSWSVPRDARFGAAAAVSKNGEFIVGLCGTSDTPSEFDSNAVIWGWGSGPRSIREILLDAGVSSVATLIFDQATGISADGRVVCGLGHDVDYNYFAWVARLPPRPSPLVDWKKIPRKFPNFPINPLFVR